MCENNCLILLLLISSIGWSESATLRKLNIQFDGATAWLKSNPLDSVSHLLKMINNPPMMNSGGLPATTFPLIANETTVKPTIDYSNMVPVQEEKIIKVDAYILCSLSKSSPNCNGNPLDRSNKTSIEQSTLPAAGSGPNLVETETNHQAETTSPPCTSTPRTESPSSSNANSIITGSPQDLPVTDDHKVEPSPIPSHQQDQTGCPNFVETETNQQAETTSPPCTSTPRTESSTSTSTAYTIITGSPQDLPVTDDHKVEPSPTPCHSQDQTTISSPIGSESLPTTDNNTNCPPEIASKEPSSTSIVQTTSKTFTQAESFAGVNQEPGTSTDKIS